MCKKLEGRYKVAMGLLYVEGSEDRHWAVALLDQKRDKTIAGPTVITDTDERERYYQIVRKLNIREQQRAS